jgi:hypothetical protein
MMVMVGPATRRLLAPAVACVVAAAVVASPATAIPVDANAARSAALQEALIPKQGDTPVDHPGASRSPATAAASTAAAVGRQRTVVREGEQTLPIALAAVALALSIGGLGVALASRPRAATRH